jgi:hypothetical protein
MTASFYAVTLRCGLARHYESRSFAPPVGESVPCPRHGYCDVVATLGDRERPARFTSRRPPRTNAEMVEFLKQNPSVTLSVLRRARFTLRLIRRAEKDGLLRVDDDERVRLDVVPQDAPTAN